ncbi:MAG: TonB-dependent receptor, partial [Pseudomonadota bacterium]
TAAARRAAPQGSLEITVRKGDQPAPSQIVLISGGGGAISTNAQGVARTQLPRGEYTVSVGDVSARVRVVGGITRGAALTLPGSDSAIAIEMPQIEEVFVLGTFDPSGMEISERDTSNIVDTIGVEMLARFSDADVAATVVRVPGISVQDDKFVFIRGLGGRYISSTLNNATMPSTNPTRRTVPLDLFPSNFVNQLDIKKTFLPFMPGESTGGNLVINTKTFPDERSGRITAGIGFLSDLTGEDVAGDPIDGTFDVIGWDDGSREEDITVQTIAQALDLGIVTDSNTGNTFRLDPRIEGELARTAAILIADDYDLDVHQATPNMRLGGDYGDLFYVGDHEIGFYAAANYRNQWSQRQNGERNSYTPTLDILDNFVVDQVTHEVIASGLFSVGWNFGNNTIEWNNVLSRVTEEQTERQVGEEGDERQSVVRHTIQWEERQFASTQLLGSHFLNEDGSMFGEWQITASQAVRYAPDRREVEFRAAQSQTDAEELKAGFEFDRTNDDQPIPLAGFFIEPGVILRRYDDLQDDNFDGSFDFTWDFFDNGSSFAKIQAGFQAIYRERDADSFTYGFNVNQSLTEVLDTPNLLASDVLYVCGEGEGTVQGPQCDPRVTEGNGGGQRIEPAVGGITNDPNTGFTFQDKTLASDSYDADLSYNSVYAMYDHTFDSTWQVIAGVRYETYDQTTNTFSLQGEQGPVQSNIDEDSILPALSVNWFYSETQQLRFAVSQTVARPDFKEAANATFYDTEFNFRVRGNPFLEISDIFNADLRWEWYFGEGEQDNLSVAAFYKDMDKPIERVVQPASGTAGNSRTFRNAESAELTGVEIEGRKEFVLTDDYNQTIFVTFNASYIDSEVIQDNDDPRALQGQPEYTANLVLGYDNLDLGHEITLLWNETGESIADVGVSGAPDVIFEPRGELNLVYRYTISDSAQLTAKVDNLLDAEVEYTQGGLVFQRHEKGTSFRVGFDWKF